MVFNFENILYSFGRLNLALIIKNIILLENGKDDFERFYGA